MTVLDRPVAAPQTLSLLHLVATLIATLLFSMGWTAGQIVQATLWCTTAIRLGWDDARRLGSD